MILLGLFVHRVFALDSFLRLEDDCQCDEGILGDGTCNDWCDNKHCYWDHGDCLPTEACHEDCEDHMLGNGVCDEVCYTDHCYWDKGDCEDTEIDTTPSLEYTIEGNIEENLCECESKRLGDGYCDPACNNEFCSKDGGDCDFSDATACSTDCWSSMWDDNVCNEA